MPSQHLDQARCLQGLTATAESRPEALSGFPRSPFSRSDRGFCLSRVKDPTRASLLPCSSAFPPCRLLQSAAGLLPRSHAKQKAHWAVLPGPARSWGARGLGPCPGAPSQAAGPWNHPGHRRGARRRASFRRDLGPWGSQSGRTAAVVRQGV